MKLRISEIIKYPKKKNFTHHFAQKMNRTFFVIDLQAFNVFLYFIKYFIKYLCHLIDAF